jgi:hypothetical protein
MDAGANLPSSPGTGRDRAGEAIPSRRNALSRGVTICWRSLPGRALRECPQSISRPRDYRLRAAGGAPDRRPTSSTGASARVRCDALVTRRSGARRPRFGSGRCRIRPIRLGSGDSAATITCSAGSAAGVYAHATPSFRCERRLDALARRKYFIPRGVDVHRPAGPYQNR